MQVTHSLSTFFAIVRQCTAPAMLLLLTACNPGSSDPASVQPVTVTYWSGTYATATSTGSIGFSIEQQGERVTGSCKLLNKIQNRTVNLPITEGLTDSTGFSFTMKETSPLIGTFTGRARVTSPTSLSITFQGSDTTGVISATASVTSVRGNGVWIGVWGSPQLPLVSFGLRLSQVGSNLVGTMLSFQSTIGLPTAFHVDGEIDGEKVHLRLHPAGQQVPEDTIELLGVLDKDTMDLAWAGNDGVVDHVAGTGVAKRVTPFVNQSSQLGGVWAGMIGSTEWQGFAVMEICQFNTIQYGISVLTTRMGSPREFFGGTVTQFSPVPASVFSTTPGCGGQLDMSLQQQAPVNFNLLEAEFTGHDCNGGFTNGVWSAARL